MFAADEFRAFVARLYIGKGCVLGDGRRMALSSWKMTGEREERKVGDWRFLKNLIVLRGGKEYVGEGAEMACNVFSKQWAKANHTRRT